MAEFWTSACPGLATPCSLGHFGPGRRKEWVLQLREPRHSTVVDLISTLLTVGALVSEMFPSRAPNGSHDIIQARKRHININLFGR